MPRLSVVISQKDFVGAWGHTEVWGAERRQITRKGLTRNVHAASRVFSEWTRIRPQADGLNSLDLAVRAEGRSGRSLRTARPAIYCPLAAFAVCAGAASESARVAQLVPAAEIH